MRRVLIVDDDGDYLEQMVRALSLDKTGIKPSEILTAGNGREAIALGARNEPRVLIIDWMLRDQMHGLHVAAALRAVHPMMQTILITGFASRDLHVAAEHNDVFAFLEKPFDLKAFRDCVRSAANTPVSRSPIAALALLEVDAEGAIRQANSRARELFHETRQGERVGHLRDLFEDETLPDLDMAVDRWVSATPRTGKILTLNLRTQPPAADGTRLVVLQRSSDPQYLHQRLVDLLLGLETSRPMPWPHVGRVLVVDGDAVSRRMAVSMLEAAGAGCYAVATHAEALRLFDNDRDIQFVILDDNIPEADISSLVGQLKARRPGVLLIGNGDKDRRAVFEALGVERFLVKPWRGIEFVDLFLDA